MVLPQVLSVQFTRGGKAIVHRTTNPTDGAPPQPQAPGGGASSPPPPALLPSLAHDRRKGVPIPPDVPHPFLQRVGLQTAQGRLKADMASKMAQVRAPLLPTPKHKSPASRSGLCVPRLCRAPPNTGITGMHGQPWPGCDVSTAAAE